MDELINFFKILSDQTRFDLLMLLLSREMCVCELVDQLQLSQSLISHHLYHLKVAGLVKMRREGTWIFYSVDHEKLNQYKLEFLQKIQKASTNEIPCKFACCNEHAHQTEVSEATEKEKAEKS